MSIVMFLLVNVTTIVLKIVGARLGGVIVSVLAIGWKLRRFKPDRGDGFLRALKIRRKESEGGGPMSSDFTACKKSLASMNRNTSQDEIHHSLRPFLLLTTK
jgi:hypothetical protein